MRMDLIIRSHFDSAHFLREYTGRCAKMHGHRWEVEVRIPVRLPMPGGGEGPVRDFKELKRVIDDVLPDHCLLNSKYDINPTAENLSLLLLRSLRTALKTEDISLRIWESPECSVEVRP
jgi:6-pyruvoyltetrahydropterin/6-carboxytetrahydropterin synthase